ncbi:MAG: response regulator [Candidatus Omnitrophica bacterium]|nr:response regulator [Candidatus Omnitrophota bacterium]
MITPEQILDANILIVEDEKVNRVILRRILTSGGFHNIRTLPNATRLIRQYEAFHPDLLVLDLHMPKVSGFDVMNALKKAYPDDYLPILVISADSDDKVHLRALSSGAKDFLNKPYEPAKVLLRCRNVIETKLLHAEVQSKNVDLERIVRERTEELHKSRLELIQRLGYAAERRDTDTGAHIVRMSRYCEAVALAMGMSAEESEQILNTAPLHDVGKIAIPDSILLKPGPLTKDEFEVMKTHAAIGGGMLANSDSAFLRMAENIARTHHERWDGKGYPQGLHGEEIPIAGRICAVCDVFDALTSERPYKKAWPFDEAVKEIKKMSGTSFDSAVVDAFIKALPQIKAINKAVGHEPLPLSSPE